MTEDDRAKKLEAEAAFLRSGMRETLRQMFRQAVQAFLPHADQHDPELARLVRETVDRLEHLGDTTKH